MINTTKPRWAVMSDDIGDTMLDTGLPVRAHCGQKHEVDGVDMFVELEQTDEIAGPDTISGPTQVAIWVADNPLPFNLTLDQARSLIDMIEAAIAEATDAETAS